MLHLRAGENIDFQAILNLLFPTTKIRPIGQTTISPRLDFEIAELFTAVFSSLPFVSEQIHERIFSTTYYEKIMCCMLSPSTDFPGFDDDRRVVTGSPSHLSDDAYATDFAQTESTANVIRWQTFEHQVIAGRRLLQK